MKRIFILIIVIMSTSFYSCQQAGNKQESNKENDFQWLTEQFADIRIMR